VVLHRLDGANTALHLSVAAAWFGHLFGALNGLLSLYTLADTSRALSPALLANVATALLLAEPLFGSTVLLEALSGSLDNGIRLEETDDKLAEGGSVEEEKMVAVCVEA
jgi:hypothetical protein